jgi:tripartite-type tricarboxylate transporter receptor subunit TctC
MQKFLSTVFVLLALMGNAFAQYPGKPLRLIIGFPPGGSADPIGRPSSSRTRPAPTA